MFSQKLNHPTTEKRIFDPEVVKAGALFFATALFFVLGIVTVYLLPTVLLGFGCSYPLAVLCDIFLASALVGGSIMFLPPPLARFLTLLNK